MPSWPSVSALRTDLATEADWIWGASGVYWRGGHRLDSIGHTYVGEIDGHLSVEVSVWPDDVFEVSLSDSAGNGWTAFMEVASRLPVSADVARGVFDQIVGEDGSCHVYPVEDGVVIAYYTGSTFWVVINERGIDDCDQRDAREVPSADEMDALDEAMAAVEEAERAAQAADAP